ncbi:MAG: hypothetical protein WBO44_14670 [Saprospiraceae bacterium]
MNRFHAIISRPANPEALKIIDQVRERVTENCMIIYNSDGSHSSKVEYLFGGFSMKCLEEKDEGNGGKD